jgi:hypothetical protein
MARREYAITSFDMLNFSFTTRIMKFTNKRSFLFHK